MIRAVLPVSTVPCLRAAPTKIVEAGTGEGRAMLLPAIQSFLAACLGETVGVGGDD